MKKVYRGVLAFVGGGFLGSALVADEALWFVIDFSIFIMCVRLIWVSINEGK